MKIKTKVRAGRACGGPIFIWSSAVTVEGSPEPVTLLRREPARSSVSGSTRR